MGWRVPIAAVVFVWAAAAVAQDAPGRPPFLLLNQERILTDSARGRALLAEEEAARQELRAKAREIEMAFEAEERRLTERRAELDATEFRALADDFDARVIEARREQDERANALAQEFDLRRRRFYAEVAPILVGLMEGVGALAIFDENSALLADQGLNITDEVITEIDGAAPPPPPPGGAAPPASDAPAAGAEREGEAP